MYKVLAILLLMAGLAGCAGKTALTPENFARLQPGMTKAAVIQIFGPPDGTCASAQNKNCLKWIYKDWSAGFTHDEFYDRHLQVMFDDSDKVIDFTSDSTVVKKTIFGKV